MRIKLGFSFGGKKKGLLANSSAITTLVGSTVEEEGTLDESLNESEAMKAKKNLIQKENFVWLEGK